MTWTSKLNFKNTYHIWVASHVYTAYQHDAQVRSQEKKIVSSNKLKQDTELLTMFKFEHNIVHHGYRTFLGDASS